VNRVRAVFSDARPRRHVDEEGRQVHFDGKVAAALMERAVKLIVRPPAIEKVNVLAAKLPD
jgi:hypothetical protein